MEVVDKKNKSQWRSIVGKFRRSTNNSKSNLDQKKNDHKKDEKLIKENNIPQIEQPKKIIKEESLQIEQPKKINKEESLQIEQPKKINKEETVRIDQHKDFKKLGFQNTTIQKENNTEKNKVSRYISIIRKLQEKKIGNFSRLESVSNYLSAGKQLLYEDEAYLKEQFSKYKEITGSGEEFDSVQTYVPNKNPSEPQTILIDDIEKEPTTNFQSLGVTIAKIIKDSTPHFTIGIYGEWGTGKTTLMKSIEKNLITKGILKTSQKILPVWFNAWQYDREENLATLSLMKNVAYEMIDHEKFDPISKTILKGLTIYGKDMTQNLIQDIVSKKQDNNEQLMEEKINQLNELNRDSIYFDGIKKIRQQMEDIRNSAGKEYRVVVFIDDLDRCSPNKALEVLESIKLFLGMDGFIFVIGLSHKTVTELITRAYKETGIRGEDYIKKIIQIPIKIPSWSQESILDLIDNKIKKNLHQEYTDFLSQNSSMIGKVVDYNPRQLKRFVNNVIIAFETFTSQSKDEKITFNEIFLVKILKSEWPDFYTELVRNPDFLELVKWILTRPKELKRYFKYLNTYSEETPAEKKQQRFLLLNRISERTQGRIDSRHCEILSDFDYENWIFFNHVRQVLFGIKDWKVVDSIMNVVEEFQYDLPVGANSTKN